MTNPAKQVAREAQDAGWLHGLARTGIAASGVVHALLGIVVLVVAFGGEGEADQAGAFKAIASAPFGFVVLWVLAAGLWALGIWEICEGVLARRAEGAKKWGRRVAEWGKATIFIALGVIAAAIALGAKPDGEQSAENASSTLLRLPAGPLLLGAVGIGIGIGGVVFVVIGLRHSFLKLVDLPHEAARAAVVGTGVVGYVAKGVALAIVGTLLVVAAVEVDPATAGGIDGAVQALVALPAGPLLAGAVGLGLLAYAVFMFLRARYAKL